MFSLLAILDINKFSPNSITSSDVSPADGSGGPPPQNNAWSAPGHVISDIPPGVTQRATRDRIYSAANIHFFGHDKSSASLVRSPKTQSMKIFYCNDVVQKIAELEESVHILFGIIILQKHLKSEFSENNQDSSRRRGNRQYKKLSGNLPCEGIPLTRRQGILLAENLVFLHSDRLIGQIHRQMPSFLDVFMFWPPPAGMG
ncbi:unnamed protein product [Caenorhabditis nigoni]